MKCFKYISVFLLALFFAKEMSGQDGHFTQFNQMPLQLNPASAGNFNGDYRIGFIGRNQWSTIPANFTSFGIAGDMKAYETKKFNSFLGTGLYYFFDQAGAGKFRTDYVNIPIAYQVSIAAGEGFINVGGGLGLGFLSKGINPSALNFDSQFTGDAFDPTAPTNEQFDRNRFSNFDLSMGYLVAFKSRGETELSLGFAVHHLNKQEESFIDDAAPLLLNQRIVLPIMFRVPFSNKWTMQFDYLLQEQGGKSEQLVGALATYYLKKDLPAQKAISFGTRYRFKDALAGIVQYRVNNFIAGFSYDVNLSPLRVASNTYGATEITATYIIQKVKEPEIRNKRQCFVF